MSIGALIEKFRTVALDRIESMNLCVVTLERTPEDAAAQEELLREIHTLKGEAKMMGFADVNLVAHQTESLLMRAANHDWRMSPSDVDLIFEGFDIIRSLLTKRTGGGNEPVDLSIFVEGVAAAIQRMEEGGEDASAPEAPAPPAVTPPEPEQPTEEMRPEELPRLEAPPVTTTTAHIEETRPVSSSRRGKVSSAQLTDASDLIEPRDSGNFRRPTSTTGLLRIQTENSLRVRFDRLERIGDIASEVVLMSRRLEFHLHQMHGLREELKDWMQLVEPAIPKSHFATLRELKHRLDATIPASIEDNHLIHLRAAQLDDEVRSLRHVSLAQAISHYPRAVRDLASGQGKRVRFLHEVGDVEVDRPVLSKLAEPLLHLVRNAVDHGIESPEERATLGKEPEAEIRLAAEHIGDSLRVTLRDDGRGIDPTFVKRRAVEKGVITQTEADQLDDQQALVLIFEAGFSTRASVSDVSGRGIGLDIVLRQITNIGGVVEVESEIHNGTVFTLLVPLSSAVISVLLIELGGRVFGMHAKDIEYVDTVHRSEIVRIHDVDCVRVDGDLLSMLDWHTTLDAPRVGDPPENQRILIVRKGSRRVAVSVDRVIGERDALNRPLGDFFQGVRMCRGVAITEMGDVVPLLNVVELLSRTHQLPDLRPSMRSTWSTMESPIKDRVKTILVAEDSEITRTLVTGILRNMGYRVLEAEDGQEGWEMLQEHHIDLVMSDVQMPRMGGLEFLQTIRRSAEYSRMPVVMLTTLGSPEDKERAMMLGADAYLTKLDFREKDLISTIQRYLERGG